MSDTANKKGKEEFGPVMARLYSFFASRSKRHLVVYEKIVGDIATLKPSTILEIGCGPGIVSAMIARKVQDARIWCVDPSHTMTEIANKRFSKLGVEERVHASIGDSENTGLEGTYDVVFTSLAFHHWTDRVKNLTDLALKHLQKGTFLIYENLIEGKNQIEKGSHMHGITVGFAESIELTGYVKKYEVIGGLIVLKFTKD